nr:hypothetical protein [Tanacetum cinerariifolium]
INSGRGVVIGISRPLSRVVTGATVIITTVIDLTGEVVVTTTATTTTTTLAVTAGIPVIGMTRETGVISPIDLPRHQGECRRAAAVPLDGLHFDDKLQFVEEPVEIVDHEVKRLK